MGYVVLEARVDRSAGQGHGDKAKGCCSTVVYRGGGGLREGGMSPFRTVAKFPTGEIFAVWDAGLLVRVPLFFGGGYLRK